MKKRGLTLAEAVVAIFMLIAGFSIVAQLFHRSMQYSTRVTLRQQAVAIANRRLEDIRVWSRSHHLPAGTLPMTNWGPFATSPVLDAYDSFFEITTDFSQPSFYNPCTRFELVNPGAPERVDITAYRTQVTVTVSWGGSARDSVRLTTYICAPTGKLSWHPRRAWLALAALWSLAAPPSPAGTSPLDPVPDAQPATYSLVITPTDGTPPGSPVIHHEQTVTYQAQMVASVGGTNFNLPCRVNWASLGPGAGSMRYIRGTNKVEFKHHVVLNGLVVYSDNLEAVLEASVTYRGRIYRASTPRIGLVP